MRSFFVSVVCVASVACGGPRPIAAPPSAAPQSPPPPVTSSETPVGTSFPITLATAPGTGAALFSAAGSGGSPIGYVSGGVAVEVLGPPEGDRIPVRFHGGMDVRAYLALSRL